MKKIIVFITIALCLTACVAKSNNETKDGPDYGVFEEVQDVPKEILEKEK